MLQRKRKVDAGEEDGNNSPLKKGKNKETMFPSTEAKKTEVPH